MTTDIKRKPIYIVMVGINKEKTKNESGMKGYYFINIFKFINIK